MNAKLHLLAAGYYYVAAEEHDKKHLAEKDAEKKTALMIVAAQNYFYSAINAIEALLAKKELHSFNHENRARKVLENRELFSDELIELFDLVDRDQRNKVTYRGEDGQKYLNIKKLAGMLRKHDE
ncbi:hypothetical protein HZB90_00070 [archaeon]|nr:hypothetical protein [archaeon]